MPGGQRAARIGALASTRVVVVDSGARFGFRIAKRRLSRLASRTLAPTPRAAASATHTGTHSTHAVRGARDTAPPHVPFTPYKTRCVANALSIIEPEALREVLVR